MIFLTIIVILIGIPVILGTLTALFPPRNVKDISDCIFERTFGWDTWRDGVKWSTAQLRKYKNKDKYFLHHYGMYKHPSEHPDYKKVFLDKVDLIMKEKNYKGKL
jgi:hypothetical protein